MHNSNAKVLNGSGQCLAETLILKTVYCLGAETAQKVIYDALKMVMSVQKERK